jgi:hypothetical protein
LLFGVLHWHKPHVRPADRLADRLAICCVIFIGLDVGLYELRRDQLYRVPERREPARPVMRTTAGFHPNEARRQLAEKRNQLRSLQLLTQCDLASRIHSVHLEDNFCQIDPNLRNVHPGRSCWFKWLISTSTLAQLMPYQAGASMPLV